MQILLSGLSQPQYYSWSILTSILDALIVGLAIGIASLILKVTVMHRNNERVVESNTYRLVASLANLSDTFHNQLSSKNIDKLEAHLKHEVKYGNTHKSLGTKLPNDLLHVIHMNAVYLLMTPIFKSLTLNAFFLNSHKIDWNEFVKMSKHDYYLIYSEFPRTRKKYAKSHPSFKICYNLYEELKGGN